MNTRQQKILEAIVREYVDTAQPVSSGILVRKHAFGASPATIRAEMKKLEADGYLIQPHTSAGRIPTDKGYRFFINSLMKIKDLTSREQQALQQKILHKSEINRLMPKVAELLADMSSSLAISGLVDFDKSEFYRAGAGRLLRKLELEENDTFDRIAEIFDFLDKNIEKLLDISKDKAIGIYIGEENPIKQMQNLSMIVSGHKLKSGGRGLIAILGPRRMKYDRNIALVEYINRLLDNL